MERLQEQVRFHKGQIAFCETVLRYMLMRLPSSMKEDAQYLLDEIEFTTPDIKAAEGWNYSKGRILGA